MFSFLFFLMLSDVVKYNYSKHIDRTHNSAVYKIDIIDSSGKRR